MSAYNTVKAGVVALSETLLHELSPHGIAESVICPSFFHANLTDSFRGAEAEVEQTGATMVSRSRRIADQVAATVIRGIDAQKDVILTDPEGQIVCA